jgi:hypothetical protein
VGGQGTLELAIHIHEAVAKERANLRGGHAAEDAPHLGDKPHAACAMSVVAKGFQ